MRLLLSLLVLTLTATSTSALSSLRQKSSRWNSNLFSRTSSGGDCCDFFTDCDLNDRCSSTCCWIFESSLGMLEEQAVKNGKHTVSQKQRQDGDDDDGGQGENDMSALQIKSLKAKLLNMQKQREDPDDGGNGENYDLSALQSSSHAKSLKGKHEMTQKQREDGDDGGDDGGNDGADNNVDLSAIETSSRDRTRWVGSSFGSWLNNLLRKNSNNNNNGNLNGLNNIQRLNMNGGTCCDNYTWCKFGSQCDGTCCWAYENGLGLVETQADAKQQIKAKNLLHAAHKAQSHHEMKMNKAQNKISSHKQRLQTSQ